MLLLDVVSRYVPDLKKNGGECHGICYFCSAGTDTLRVGETWRTLCCSAQHENGNDAIGFLASFEQITREEAQALIESGNLPEPHPIDTSLRQAPFCSIPQLTKYPETRVWIHDNYDAMRAARELVPDRVHLGLIPGRSWADLRMLKDRHVVLVPTNTATAIERMERLADCLYDAGHEAVRWIEPAAWDGSELPEHWTLVDAKASGATTEQVMAWARDRVRAYPKNDAAQQMPESARTGLEGESPSAAAASPASLTSPNATPPELPAPAAPSLPELPARTPSAAKAQQPGGAAPHAEVAAPMPEMQPRAAPQAARPNLAVVEPTGALRKPDPEPEPELPAFSEFALAKAFADGPGTEWRHTAAWGMWARWNSVRWVQDERKFITWETKNCCAAVIQEHLADSTPAGRLKVGSLRTVNAVIGLAGADPRIAVGADQWDANPWLLGTPGGIIDLKLGKLIEADKAQLISKSTLIAPIEGPHPLFDRVMARPTQPDGMLPYLWRWLGYILTGDVREERFLFLHGVGNSGKGTLIKVVADILGDYAKAISVQAFTETQQQRHSQEIAKLQGARFVYASETEEGSRFDEAMLKWLTGRDKITAHKMRQDDIEFYPQFKLLIYGNNRPSLKSVGEDMRRRIDLVEFPGTIPEAERDSSLKDKLQAEYPMILHSMIRACSDWQRAGALGKPQSVSLATENYLRANDVLGDFIEDCLDISQQSTTLSGAAYKRFTGYCSERGEKYVMSHRAFTQRLETRGYPAAKLGGSRIYRGFTLKATGFEPYHERD